MMASAQAAPAPSNIHNASGTCQVVSNVFGEHQISASRYFAWATQLLYLWIQRLHSHVGSGWKQLALQRNVNMCSQDQCVNVAARWTYWQMRAQACLVGRSDDITNSSCSPQVSELIVIHHATTPGPKLSLQKGDQTTLQTLQIARRRQS